MGNCTSIYQLTEESLLPNRTLLGDHETIEGNAETQGPQVTSTLLSDLCLLVIGASGTAKTSVINYVASYFESGWLGNLKFVISTSRNDVNVSGFPLHSETECTVYRFERERYTLTVVDTPGFSSRVPIAIDKITDIMKKVGPVTGVLSVINEAESGRVDEVRDFGHSIFSQVPSLLNAKLIVAHVNAATQGFAPEPQVTKGGQALEFALSDSVFHTEGFRLLSFDEKVEIYVQWATAMHYIRQTVRALRGQELVAEVSGFDMKKLYEFCGGDIPVSNRDQKGVQGPAPVTEESIVIDFPDIPDPVVQVPTIKYPIPLAFSDPKCSTLLLLSEVSSERVTFLRHFVSTLPKSPLCAEVSKRIVSSSPEEFTIRDETILVRRVNDEVTGCAKFFFCTLEQTHVVVAAPEIKKVEDDFADPEYVCFLARGILNVGVLRSVVFVTSEQTQHHKLPLNILRMLCDVTPAQSEVVITSVAISAKGKRARLVCENPGSVKSSIPILGEQGNWMKASEVILGIAEMQERLPTVRIVIVNPNAQRKEELKAKLFRVTENLAKSQLIVDVSTKVLKVQDQIEQIHSNTPLTALPTHQQSTSSNLPPSSHSAQLPPSDLVVSTCDFVKTKYHNTLCRFPGCNSRVCHEGCGLMFISAEGSNGFRDCACMTGDRCHVCGHGYQSHLHAHYLKELKNSTFQDVLATRKRNVQASLDRQMERLRRELAEDKSAEIVLPRILELKQKESVATLSLLVENKEELAGAKRSLLKYVQELKKVSATEAFFSQEVNEMYQKLKNTHQKLQEKEIREESEEFLKRVKTIMKAAS